LLVPVIGVHRGFIDQGLELCLIHATHRGRVAELPVVTRESYRDLAVIAGQ